MFKDPIAQSIEAKQPGGDPGEQHSQAIVKV
jgi:hypothetical protein